MMGFFDKLSPGPLCVFNTGGRGFLLRAPGMETMRRQKTTLYA